MGLSLCGCLTCIANRLTWSKQSGKSKRPTRYEPQKAVVCAPLEAQINPKMIVTDLRDEPFPVEAQPHHYGRSVSHDAYESRPAGRRLSTQLSHPSDSANCSTEESGYGTIERPTAPNTSDETVNEWTESTEVVGRPRRRTNFLDWTSRLLNSKGKTATTNDSRLSDYRTGPGSWNEDNILSTSSRQGLCFANPAALSPVITELQHMAQSTRIPDPNEVDGCEDYFSHEEQKGLWNVSETSSTGRNFSMDASIHPHDLDSVSSTLTFGMIDPIYTKIQNSTDGFIDPEFVEQDFHWCQSCCKRTSWTSTDSQKMSSHPSAHIYCHPCKQLSDPHTHNHHSSDCDGAQSVWSFRPMGSGECLTKRHSLEASCDISASPPQIPARLYGPSTVNLVDRLRRLLNSKTAHRVSLAKHALNGVHNTFALSDLLKDPPDSKENSDSELHHQSIRSSKPWRLRLTNTSGPDDNIPLKPRLILKKIKHDPIKFPNVLRTKMNLLHAPVRHAVSLETTVRSNRTLSSSSIWDRVEGDVDEFGALLNSQNAEHQSVNPTESIEVNSHSSSGQLVVDELKGRLRHIDSEIDLKEASRSRSARLQNLSPLRHIYLPGPYELSTKEERKAVFPVIGTQKLRQRFRSPAHRVSPMPEAMSPLMERSIEDEDTRRLLLAPH